MNDNLKNLIRVCREKGYLEYDITVTKTKFRNRLVKENKYMYTCGNEEGISIRVIDQMKRFSQVSVSFEAVENIHKILDDFLNLSEPLQKKLYSHERKEISVIEKIYNQVLDEEFQAYSFEFLREITSKISCLGGVVIDGVFSYIEDDVLYYNPIQGEQKYKANRCIILIVIRIFDINRKAHHFTFQNNIEELSKKKIEDIYLEIFNLIKPYIKYKPVDLPPGQYNIVFSNAFFYYIFTTYFLNDFYHKNAISKTFIEEISLYDDGTIEGGFGSKPFDAEGTSTRITKLIDKGKKIGSFVPMLQSIKYNLEPTGNMKKERFFSKPKLDYNNLVFTLDSDIKEVEYIYINTGGTGELTNIFFSDFNILVKGTEKIPINSFYFELDYSKLFSDISALSEKTILNLGIYHPEFIFKNIKIME